ncbi:hypothetical protein ACFQ0B_67515 [Nonomuraea thailandensis]
MSYAGTGKHDRETPAEHVQHLLSGFWHSQIIFVLARLRVADELAAGPRPARSWQRPSAPTPAPCCACCGPPPRSA